MRLIIIHTDTIVLVDASRVLASHARALDTYTIHTSKILA